jgi:hypothetical protein
MSAIKRYFLNVICEKVLKIFKILNLRSLLNTV